MPGTIERKYPDNNEYSSAVDRETYNLALLLHSYSKWISVLAIIFITTEVIKLTMSSLDISSIIHLVFAGIVLFAFYRIYDAVHSMESDSLYSGVWQLCLSLKVLSIQFLLMPITPALIIITMHSN